MTPRTLTFIVCSVLMFTLLGCVPPEITVEAGTPRELYKASGAGALDGVVVSERGDVYFSEGDRVMRLGSDGKAEDWAKLSKPLGHKIQSNGTHIICDGEEEAVYLLNGGGKIVGKISEAEGHGKIGAPNDVALDERSGGFYFTVPNAWNFEKPEGELFYTDGEGRTRLVANRLPYYNGVVVDAAGEFIYLSSSTRSRIDRFKIVEPGVIVDRELYCNLPQREKGGVSTVPFAPDGLCMDESGILFLAHYGKAEVHVIGLDGSLIKSIGAFMRNVTNVALSRGRLYICGAGIGPEGPHGSLYSVNVKIGR